MDLSTKAEARKAQIAAARKAGQAEMDSSPQAQNCYYAPGHHQIVIEFNDGSEYRAPVQNLQGLENATEAELSNIEISPSGLGLSWPDLDADLSIPQLMRGIYGTKQWMAALAAKGGRSKSVAKQAAAKKNGRKGGRPRKSQASDGLTGWVQHKTKRPSKT